MSDQLREMLRDLAQDAPAMDTTPVAAGDAWRRARRSKRRDVIAAVSLSVVLLLVGGLVIGLIGPSLQSTPPTAPAYGDGRLHIPNQIWVPSPWTPGTADAGPIGPLALIATAPRHTSWWHTEDDALFGVSAKTGQYRFLDIAGLDFGGDPVGSVALSPDGKWLAYWKTGEVSSPGRQSNIVAIAIYNTESGSVSVHPLPTKFGVDPDWLSWSGNSEYLAFSYSNYRDGRTRRGSTTAYGAGTFVWALARGRVFHTNELSDGYPPVTPATTGGFTYFKSHGKLVTWNPESGGEGTSIWVNPPGAIGAVVSPDGRNLVFAGNNRTGWGSTSIGRDSSSGLYLASKPSISGSPWQTHRVWADYVDDTYSLYGWIDSSHVLAFNEQRRIFESIQVHTARWRRVIELGDGLARTNEPSLASGLVDRPFVQGRQPLSPRDPRIVPGIIAGCGLA